MKHATTALLAAAVIGIAGAGCQTQMEHACSLPELVDEEYPTVNRPLRGDTRIKYVWIQNSDAIRQIQTNDTKVVRTELRSRMDDSRRPMATRLLYAGILANLNDPAGQEYLLQQGHAILDPERLADLYWVIGHLDWFYPCTKNGAVQEARIQWAEKFMLEALQDRTEVGSPGLLVYSRRDLAVGSWYGDFAEILAKAKSQGLYDVLVILWKEHRVQEVFNAFGELGDRRAIPLLMESLKTGKEDEYRSAARALEELGAREAIPVLLEHLSDRYTYFYLSSYKDARILPAVKNAVPNLTGSARGAALLLVSELEGGDQLTQLLSLAADSQLGVESEAMKRITELRDVRAVPFAVRTLATSPDMYRRGDAIDILVGVTNSSEAVKGLIDALDIDFNALAEGKSTMEDNNERYRGRIAGGLKLLTGRDFGMNKVKWLEYYRETYKPEAK